MINGGTLKSFMAVSELLESHDRDELQDQIAVRRELKAQMIGSLYPSILSDEIVLIQQRINEIPVCFNGGGVR